MCIRDSGGGAVHHGLAHHLHQALELGADAGDRHGDHPQAVDLGVDEDHGQVDKDILQGDGSADAQDNPDMPGPQQKGGEFKVKPKGAALDEQIAQGKQAGHRLACLLYTSGRNDLAVLCLPAEGAVDGAAAVLGAGRRLVHGVVR